MHPLVSQMFKGSNIEHLCCGEGCIYWLVEEWDFAQVTGWILMEYDITTNDIAERAHWIKGKTGSLNLRIKEMYVNNHYIYLNIEDRYGFYSWRVSMENWKIERLIKGKLEDWEKYKDNMLQSNINKDINWLIDSFSTMTKLNYCMERHISDYFYVCIE